jgi:flavin-dependent dehydrogenase
VLLIDRKEIGTHQSSACATLLGVMQALDAMDCVLQIHRRIVVTGPRGPIRYPLAHPFCTFDFEKFVRKLARRADAEFLLAQVTGARGNVVQTTRGDFEGKVLVDATGWGAALARSVSPRHVNKRSMSFGIETLQPYRGDGLLFWYDPTRYRPKQPLWIFPCGDFSRIGVASYVGETKLKSELERFTRALGVGADGLHGGYFPYALREPTVGDIFVVGDAAGQCFAVTGEGIRNAIYFGQAAGCIVRRVVDGELSLAQGLAEYRRFVHGHHVYFAITYWIQKILSNAPSPLADGILRFFRLPFVLPNVLQTYVEALNPAALRREPDSGGVRLASRAPRGEVR